MERIDDTWAPPTQDLLDAAIKVLEWHRGEIGAEFYPVPRTLIEQLARTVEQATCRQCKVRLFSHEWRDGICSWCAEGAETELATAQANLTVLQRELDEERRRFPADGVWLVQSTPGQHSQVLISPLAELPEPATLASIALHRDALAEAVRECWQLYSERGHQAPLDVADAIVRALHRTLVDTKEVL